MAETSVPAQASISACRLDGKGGCQSLSLVSFAELTAAGPVWVHLDYSTSVAGEWLRQHSGLEPLVIDGLLSEDTRPSSSPFQQGLLLSLRGVNFNAGAEPEDMVAIRLWLEEGAIISSGQRQLATVATLRRQLEAGRGPVSVAKFLLALTSGIIDHIAETLEELEDDCDSLEEQVQQQEKVPLRSRLADLRRTAIALRRYLLPQREALVHLQNEQIAWLKKADRLHLREHANRLSRYLEELEAISARALVMQEELASRQAEQLNRRMYALTLVATVFMPLSFVAGLLGINVGGIPGASSPYAFWTVVGLVLVVIILQLLYLKKKKWF